MKKRILIYHVAGIGDTLVALPAFRMIQQNFPDTELHLLNISVVPSLPQAELYEHNTLFTRTTFLKPGGRLLFYFYFLLAVLRASYSALYCFSPSPPKALTLLFRLFRGRRIYHCTPDLKHENIMLAEGYLKRLEALGLSRGNKDLFAFASTPEEISHAEKIALHLRRTHEVPMIAFGIGGREDVCRWPLQRYEELIGRLSEKYAFSPVYLGGEDDREAADMLRRKYGGIFLFDTECRSLRRTIAFLRFCLCYIGNDTGSMHLAATAGIPCAAVFSAHDLPPNQWHPFSRNSFILRREMECSGCNLRTCRFGNPAKCLASIATDDFYQALAGWDILKTCKKS